MSVLTSLLDSLNGVSWQIKVLSGTLVTSTIVVYAIFRRQRILNRKMPPKPRVVYPRDKVIFHNLGRGPFAPSLVPYAVKLETYMRMNKVPYIHVPGEEKSPKGKFPWIEYNDEIVSDSAFCIKFINKTFNIDTDSRFTKEELSTVHAFRKMMEENTYWTFVLTRWMYDKKNTVYHYAKIPLSYADVMHQNLTDATHKHGIGRHSEEEVYSIMREDLSALSIFLGKKKYLLGDHPCEADCAIFGQLSQFYWQCVDTKAEEIVKEFENLCAYCERMKDEFWPDWSECNTCGGTKEV